MIHRFTAVSPPCPQWTYIPKAAIAKSTLGSRGRRPRWPYFDKRVIICKLPSVFGNLRHHCNCPVCSKPKLRFHLNHHNWQPVKFKFKLNFSFPLQTSLQLAEQQLTCISCSTQIERLKDLWTSFSNSQGKVQDLRSNKSFLSDLLETRCTRFRVSGNICMKGNQFFLDGLNHWSDFGLEFS